MSALRHLRRQVTAASRVAPAPARHCGAPVVRKTLPSRIDFETGAQSGFQWVLACLRCGKTWPDAA